MCRLGLTRYAWGLTGASVHFDELDWNDILRRGKAGIGISEDEAQALSELEEEDKLQQVFLVTNALRQHFKKNEVYTCGITNAKSGACPEKCNFCSADAPPRGLEACSTCQRHHCCGGAAAGEDEVGDDQGTLCPMCAVEAAGAAVAPRDSEEGTAADS